jgi:FKBP-type peptidyl-prolyl cis-trans isomerase FklB
MKYIQIIFLFTCVVFTSNNVVAQNRNAQSNATMNTSQGGDRKPFEPLAKLETDADSLSYALGINVGQGLLSQLIQIPDIKAFATGIQDALNANGGNDGFKLSDEAISEILMRIQNQMMYRQQEKMRELQAENLIKANAFLDENKTKEGVMTTPSGLQYRIIKEGNGPMPIPMSSVTVHYVGTLLDGTEFDSSRRRGQPATFPVTGVIEGWTEGLQLMKAGSVFEFYIPPSLGYGQNGNQRIPPNALLIFEVELLEVSGE